MGFDVHVMTSLSPLLLSVSRLCLGPWMSQSWGLMSPWLLSVRPINTYWPPFLKKLKVPEGLVTVWAFLCRLIWFHKLNFSRVFSLFIKPSFIFPLCYFADKQFRKLNAATTSSQKNKLCQSLGKQRNKNKKLAIMLENVCGLTMLFNPKIHQLITSLIAFCLLLHGKKCHKAQRKQTHWHAYGTPACRW